MSISKLKRVIMRIKERNPNAKWIKESELERATIIEIGTDPRTVKGTRHALRRIGWIKIRNRRVFIMPEAFTEDFF